MAYKKLCAQGWEERSLHFPKMVQTLGSKSNRECHYLNSEPRFSLTGNRTRFSLQQFIREVATPVYDYICQDCQKSFELVLTLGEHEKNNIACPKWEARKWSRIPPPFSRLRRRRAKDDFPQPTHSGWVGSANLRINPPCSTSVLAPGARWPSRRGALRNHLHRISALSAASGKGPDTTTAMPSQSLRQLRAVILQLGDYAKSYECYRRAAEIQVHNSLLNIFLQESA